jgi:hypothetical protein
VGSEISRDLPGLLLRRTLSAPRIERVVVSHPSLVRRIDEETRQAISDASDAIEADGWEVNRRALAREHGVSPQTVARILDGPDARRGAPGVSSDRRHSSSSKRLAIGLGAFATLLWWLYRRTA